MFGLLHHRYPPLGEIDRAAGAAVGGGSYGVGPHKDGGFLSLLLQDGPGLQVGLQLPSLLIIPTVAARCSGLTAAVPM